jgi:hypothetical protein
VSALAEFDDDGAAGQRFLNRFGKKGRGLWDKGDGCQYGDGEQKEFARYSPSSQIAHIDHVSPQEVSIDLSLSEISPPTLALSDAGQTRTGLTSR